jgi:hypothetical protein
MTVSKYTTVTRAFLKEKHPSRDTLAATRELAPFAVGMTFNRVLNDITPTAFRRPSALTPDEILPIHIEFEEWLIVTYGINAQFPQEPPVVRENAEDLGRQIDRDNATAKEAEARKAAAKARKVMAEAASDEAEANAAEARARKTVAEAVHETAEADAAEAKTRLAMEKKIVSDREANAPQRKRRWDQRDGDDVEPMGGAAGQQPRHIPMGGAPETPLINYPIHTLPPVMPRVLAITQPRQIIPPQAESEEITQLAKRVRLLNAVAAPIEAALAPFKWAVELLSNPKKPA